MNEKIEFAQNLEKRTLQFAINIIRFSATLGNSVENKVIRNQISKSGTSVGANYREANRSRSRTDFKNKISICLSEASETFYWLELIKELKISKNEFDFLVKETNELISIFFSIIKKLNNQKR
jgi:four helix bundle protein